jgi:hypothetical protein
VPKQSVSPPDASAPAIVHADADAAPARAIAVDPGQGREDEALPSMNPSLMEDLMPTDTLIVVASVIGAFAFFSVVVIFGDMTWKR